MATDPAYACLLQLDHVMFQCDLVSPVSSTDSIWQDWTQLMPLAPERVQLLQPAGFRCWAETWGSSGQWTGSTALITARDAAGTLRGILPLGRPRLGPFRIYSTGGHNVPFRGIIADASQEKAVGAAIGRFIASQSWPCCQMGPLLTSSPADRKMIEQLEDCGVFVRSYDVREEITLHVPFTWEEYLSQVLSSKFARKVRYYQRRMAKSGHTSIRHYHQASESEVEEMFSALTRIESASWMATRESAVPRFMNAELTACWKRLTQDVLVPHGHLDCWILEYEHQPVSFCFTLTNGSIRYVIANNYDNAVRDHRTGSILYWNMIQEGISRGVRRFEFADGDLHYKSRWGARVSGTQERYVVIPQALLGRAAAAADRLRDRLAVRRPIEMETEPAETESQVGASVS